MARLAGEKCAKDHGYSGFGADPFAIAAENDILVEGHEPEAPGMSGCIVFNDDGVGIIYSKAIKSSGFQRFTVAHELGHYFIEGHPEEILKSGITHVSKAGFTQGQCSIEIEADHFASGLLMPTDATKKCLQDCQIGLAGIQELSTESNSSMTAAAIRAAECAPYPMAIVVSQGDEICYGFLSEAFKQLGHLQYPRKGMSLPASATRNFNKTPENIYDRASICSETTLSDWFEGAEKVVIDEEIIGLGSYGFTLTVFSSEALPEEPYEDEDDEDALVDSWTPKFARGR